MNITTVSSNLDWKTNNKGTWKALIKDLEPNGTITFSEGYTATVSGRMVTVSNSTRPVGTVTYATDDDNAISAGLLYGAGSVSDSLEAVAGDKTVRMWSVDLGTLDWYWDASNGWWRVTTTSRDQMAPANAFAAVCSKYPYVGFSSNSYDKTSFYYANNYFGIRDSDLVGLTAEQVKASLSGVMLYYELATPTTSTEIPQSLSLTTGDDTLSGGSFDTVYEGTDYSIPLIRNCKYLHRSPDGTESLVTGSTTNTSIDVKGGKSKLVNLTHWFGRNREPSIEDFYKLYPTWKTYDIPYDQGSVLNYKGTGVETIGFNAYDHSTGTAALLGGNKYQICGTYTSVSYVDIFGNTETLSLDGAGCFTPVNDGTLTVTGGNGTDTCVHLVWSGYNNYGEPEYKWEPFVRNVKELPISTYFPEGMNGIEDASDELTSEQFIVRFRVIDLGDVTWTKQDTQKVFIAELSNVNIDKITTVDGLVTTCCSRYVRATSNEVWQRVMKSYTLGGITITSQRNKLFVYDPEFEDSTAEQFKEAMSGVLFIYETATPVVTQLDQPLNLAYHVNDFGTEHSLPQNTTTLVTTDLKALIKYNTDYMRMNSQLSGIFPTVKSLAQQEQDGHIMKKDDTAPNAIVGGAFNLIDRNAEGTERQFSYDTAGGSQDITDGTAVAKKSMGTTLNLNQLVHDTNQNTVTGNGQVEVEDAVAGDVTSLVVEGRSLVRNQLVPPSLEETENSANGVVEVTDAVAGDALALKMTAPRSVVVNQLFNVNVVINPSSAYLSITKSIDDNSVLINGTTTQSGIWYARLSVTNTPLVTGHVMMLYGGSSSIGVRLQGNTSAVDRGTGTKLTVTSEVADVVLNITYEATTYTNIKVTPYVIDLTQYFNGDSVLIDSITSWDDLVAYDPRFASYVEYNTGEVAGVKPSVQVTGGNIFDISQITNPYNLTISDGVIVTASYGCSSNKKLKELIGNVPIGTKLTISCDRKLLSGTPAGSVGLVACYQAGRLLPYLNNIVAGTVYHSSNTVELTEAMLEADVRFYGNSDVTNYAVEFSNLVITVGEVEIPYEPYRSAGVATSPVPLYGVGTAADSYDAVTGKVGHKTRSISLPSTGWVTYGFSVWKGFSCVNVLSVAENRPFYISSNSAIPSILTGSHSPNDIVHAWLGVNGTTAVFVVWDENVTPPAAWLTDGEPDVRKFMTWLASNPVNICYATGTPTEELLTSSTISLQQGSNVAMQTDGGRTTPFSLTYDGTEFTLPLDSTHKYAFSDNGTKSIVTNATEQAVTGGQDMLVDVTRMFNGDTTAINAVTSWADMAAVMPEYLSNVAYNEGEVVGRSGGVTTTSGSSATFSDLHGVGDVKETLDIVTGKKQVKYGEVDLGTLTWSKNASPAYFFANFVDGIRATTSEQADIICGKYVNTTRNILIGGNADKAIAYSFSNTGTGNDKYVYVADSGASSLTATQFKEYVSGIILYYELATSTTSTETAQPLTFAAGLNNVHEENMDITGTPVTMEYTGTDYEIAAKTSRVYLKDVDGTVERVTGVSSFSVRGGRDNIMDLTRMFGAGLEPGTLDAFYNLFPAWNGYRLPYNKGSLLNFKGTGLKSVGFNLLDIEGRTLGQPQNTALANTTIRGPFDETKYYVGFAGNNYYQPLNVAYYSVSSTSITVKTGAASSYGVAFPIRVIPGQTYRVENRKYGILITYYTYNGTYISYSSDTYSEAPANAYWGLIIYTSPNVNTQITYSDPCVHLQWSGTRNGDYEPYWDYVRPIPTLTYFPDGMNGRGQVYDEINPRQAIKRFGKVDLGTLEWTWATGSGGYWYSNSLSSSIKSVSTTTDIGNAISSLYTPMDMSHFNGLESNLNSMAIGTNGLITVNNGSTTESPSGWLVYELATPVITTFPEEISATARISDYGTEECLPVNGYDPVTTPFRGMVLYQEDYARTITKLPENYISKESLENLLSLLNNLHNGNISMTYNQSTTEYNFSFTPNN